MAIKNLEKMDIYNPTNYVNNSEPYIDADNLNKTENKLEETVAKANEIIDALKTLISTVQTNSDNTVPSSSLAYAMQQEITKNKEDIATANSNLPYIDTSKKIKDGFANGTSWTATENCIVCGSIGFNSSAHGCYVSVNSITIFWVNNDAATNSFAPVCFAVHKGDAVKFIGYDNQVPILTNLYAFSTK